MKNSTILAAALAGALLAVASGAAKAEPFDLGFGGRGLAVKKAEPETRKAAADKAKVAAGSTKGSSGKRGRTAKSASHGYSTIIARYAMAYGVPVSLAHAVVEVESNFRPNLVGSAGEIGLMQIKPATARMMGYSGSSKGLFHPETNIKYGMKYLAKAHDLGGGTTCGTILRYNAGHGAKRMNPVSSAYCKKVKVHLAALGTAS